MSDTNAISGSYSNSSDLSYTMPLEPLNTTNEQEGYSFLSEPFETNIPQQESSFDLNQASDSILGGLGDIGGFLEDSTVNDGIKIVDDNFSDVNDIASGYWDMGKALYERAPLASVAKKTMRNLYAKMKPGTLGKALSGVGGVVNAYTGISDTLISLHHDRERGDKDYKSTMISVAKTVGNMAVSGLAYGATAALFSTATLAAAPAGVAIGVGLGAGYLAGKAYQGITSWLTK